MFKPLSLLLLLLPLRHELAVRLVVHDTRLGGGGALDDLSDQLILLGGSRRCYLKMVISMR